MSASASWPLPAAPTRPGSSASRLAAVVGASLLAAALAVFLARAPLPEFLTAGWALAAGIALVAGLALALVAFDLAVGVAVGLTAAVFVEPAPADAALLLLLAVAAVTGRLALGSAPVPVKFLVAALLLLNGVSLMDSVDLASGLRFAGITAYLAVLALWLCTWLDSPRRARLVLCGWLVGAVGSAVLGIAAFYLPVPAEELLLANEGTRVRALFKDPNVFGPFLVPVVVIVLEQRIRPRLLRLGGLTSSVVVALLLLAILLSFSRAAWINCVLAIGVMLAASAITRRGGAKAARTLLLLILVGAAALGVLGATGSLDFLQERAQLQSYDSDRFDAQRAGYELGFRHPVGIGPGQFGYYNAVETHSTYVRMLAEQGFMGLLAWIGLVVATLVLAIRNTIRGIDTYGIGAPALLGVWCGLVLSSFVIDTLHWRHLWLAAALVWAGALRGARAPQLEGTAAIEPPRSVTTLGGASK